MTTEIREKGRAMSKTKIKTHYWTTYHDYKRVYELRSYPAGAGNCFGKIYRLWSGGSSGYVWEAYVAETRETLGWFAKVADAKSALLEKYESEIASRQEEK